MTRIDTAELSSIILQAPAWAQIGLTVDDENIRERAATELAIVIAESLTGFPDLPDFDQLSLPL
ncbi:MAG: DUF6771 family protein [Sphingobium sp.]